MNEMMIVVTVPQVPGLLQAILTEFGWDFENKSPHPVTTGNCDGHTVPRASGSLDDDGYYENASYSCSHCYPGSNPARLDWSKFAISLTCHLQSSKQIRILEVFHRVNDTRVGVCFSNGEYKLPW